MRQAESAKANFCAMPRQTADTLQEALVGWTVSHSWRLRWQMKVRHPRLLPSLGRWADSGRAGGVGTGQGGRVKKISAMVSSSASLSCLGRRAGAQPRQG